MGDLVPRVWHLGAFFVAAGVTACTTSKPATTTVSVERTTVVLLDGTAERSFNGKQPAGKGAKTIPNALQGVRLYFEPPLAENLRESLLETARLIGPGGEQVEWANPTWADDGTWFESYLGPALGLNATYQVEGGQR
jgi:hypothetical protein